MSGDTTLLALTAYDDEMAAIAEVTVPPMRSYFAAQGVDFEDIRVAQRGQNAWLKIPAILDGLKRGHDFVLWLDADIVITHGAFGILQEATPGRDLFMCWHEFEDAPMPPHFNAGVILIRNTDWSRRFFERVLETGELSPLRNYWREQAAMLHLLGHDDIIGYADERDDKDNADRKKTGRLDWRWNSIVLHASVSDPVFRHYAGMTGKFREELIKLDMCLTRALQPADREARISLNQMVGRMRMLNDEGRRLATENESLRSRCLSLEKQRGLLFRSSLVPSSWKEWLER